MRRQGLLIGVGSVGKHHAKIMANRYEKLFLVDPAQDVADWLRGNIECEYEIFTSLSEAIATPLLNSLSTTAVISHLAPDHFEAFTKLADAGVRHIVCEKPISDSLFAGREMVDRADQEDIRLAVGFPRRFSKTAKTINSVSNSELGGPPSSLVVHGGAKCLVTFGAHFVDLALDIFDKPPLRVAGFGSSQPINPRRKDLGYWEGSLSWEFPGNRYLTISFTNQSSVQALGVLYAPHGTMNLYPDGRVTMVKRNMEEIAKDPRVTRVGVCVDTPTQVIPANAPSELSVILDEVESESDISYSSKVIMESLEASIGGLIAAETKQVVEFPISKDHPMYRKSWNVT
jgi:predicted dehydrogenase